MSGPSIRPPELFQKTFLDRCLQATDATGPAFARSGFQQTDVFRANEPRCAVTSPLIELLARMGKSKSPGPPLIARHSSPAIGFIAPPGLCPARARAVSPSKR